MSSNLDKKFYTELVSESYKTTDIHEISNRIHSTLDVYVSPGEVYKILREDYELEHRKMEYSLSMNYIFD